MQVKIRSFIFLVAIAMICSTINPVGVRGQTPDSEKRSSIHEIDGFAYLSEDKTLSQIRSEAFALAKRQALEAAQTYIKSKTQVNDFTLTYDLIWSEAEGSVRVLEQKDNGVVDNSRYHVWIKAEVFYDLAPKAAMQNDTPTQPRQQNPLDDSSGPLTVNVWTDKKTFTKGEEVVIYIQGNRDFSAVVVDVMANGDIIQLLPNTHREDNFFKAGEKYRIPGPQDQFELKASPPYGTDKIVVYASDAVLKSLPTRAVGGGLGAYSGTQKDLSVSARGIHITSREKKQPSQGIEFFEAEWSFSTRP